MFHWPLWRTESSEVSGLNLSSSTSNENMNQSYINLVRLCGLMRYDH